MMNTPTINKAAYREVLSRMKKNPKMVKPRRIIRMMQLRRNLL
jgi:hypothetical protein